MKIFVHVNGGDQDFYMIREDIPDIGDYFVENGGIVYEAGTYFIDSNNDYFKEDTLLGGYQKHCIYAKIIRNIEDLNQKQKEPDIYPPVAKSAIGFGFEPMMASDLVNQLNDFIHAYGDVEIDGVKQEKDSNNHNFMFRVSMNYGATSINIFKPRKDGI